MSDILSGPELEHPAPPSASERAEAALERAGTGPLPERAAMERPRPAQERSPRPRTPPRRSGGGVAALALVFSLLALVLSAAALFLTLRNQAAEEAGEPTQEEETPEPVTFFFGDKVLTLVEELPRNPYDREGFGLDEKNRVTYAAEGRRAKAGIDVSTHQGDIDWQAVAADGIDFAMLRLGLRGYARNGKVLEDTAFRQNLQGALDAELDVGVYFFSQAITVEEAEEEAQFVLDTLDGQALDLPVAFDWEPILGDEARTDGLDGATATRCAVAFCEKIQEAGYQAAVYFNQNQGYLHYDLRDLKDYVLWLAEYGTVPDFYYHFDMWQYTHRGQVDGIQGDVDLDLLF